MTKTAILIAVLFISYDISAQEAMKKIQLKEGTVNHITYQDLNISTLLQVYNEQSAAHLAGDIYLRVDNAGDPIADFYVAHDSAANEYYTRIYKHYFFTFVIENNKKYLVIEQAQFGKAFALSSRGSAIVGTENGLVKLEITDAVHESGYDGPPEEDNRSYFDAVQYTLRVTVEEEVKDFSFYSSEIKDGLVLDLDRYSIQILSDQYKDSLSLIEMVVNQK